MTPRRREGAGDAPPAGTGDPGPERASGADEEAPAASGPCDLCGGPTLERHCKIVCLRCGYTRDCSDP